MSDDLIVTMVLDNPTERDALRAVLAWFEAEDKHLGTFNDRMELCNYAEWASRKAMGEDVGPYEGVPQIKLVPRFNRK